MIEKASAISFQLANGTRHEADSPQLGIVTPVF
jgi:hypothetical protein